MRTEKTRKHNKQKERKGSSEPSLTAKDHLKAYYSPEKTDKETLVRWLQLMVLGRMIDERAPNYLKQALGWSYHAPYAGHDGIQLAIGQIFNRKEDHFFPYYRDMLSSISAGMTAEEILLNGISKATDPSSGGRHMSNHFAKPEWNIHNTSSCTGNHLLHAVGIARALKYYKEPGIAISSQGESSVSEGYCYEGINGASCEKLPVIFVFQDNGYGISVPKSAQTANEFVADNFTGFKNLEIIHCDGKDIFSSMNAMTEAKRIIKEQGVPVIVHAHCVRMGAHSNSDKHELYRDEKELKDALSQDPLLKYKEVLFEKKIINEDELKKIESDCKEVVLAAHKAAMKAPAPSADSIYDFVIGKSYRADVSEDQALNSNAGEELTMVSSLNKAIKVEFKHNPDTFMWGQDMANKEKGGIFNVSKGLQPIFGDKRIFNAPIAEDFIMGTANGMSRYHDRLRLLVEGAEFADYFWPAMEQFVDTSHDYWRSNGKFSPNITVRLASGGYIGGGLYHSQNIEGTLCTFPGVRVVVPAFADDAYGLLRTCLRSQGMSMFLEPKALYNAKQAKCFVPDDYFVPFGKCRVRREGTDLTVLTYGNTVHHSLEAADIISSEGKGEVEVVDLRSLSPLDEEGILKSLKKTNRVLVVHEDKLFGGFGGELVAMINEKGFELLDAPVKRIGASFTPVGFNRILERSTLPNAETVKAKMLEMLKY